MVYIYTYYTKYHEYIYSIYYILLIHTHTHTHTRRIMSLGRRPREDTRFIRHMQTVTSSPAFPRFINTQKRSRSGEGTAFFAEECNVVTHWKMPNSVLKKAKFWICYKNFYRLKKRPTLINTHKFQGQPLKKGQICYFWHRKTLKNQPDNPGNAKGHFDEAIYWLQHFQYRCNRLLSGPKVGNWGCFNCHAGNMCDIVMRVSYVASHESSLRDPTWHPSDAEYQDLTGSPNLQLWMTHRQCECTFLLFFS